MTKRLSTLATRKAIYEVDDVDLIRANTENTWPIVARYMSDLGLSKSNILLDLGANANLTMSMPYHFDIGPNVFWLARDINGQVNQLDFIGGFPSPANTAIVTNTWGTGSFTANVRITQPDSNLDIFAVNVYSNSDLVANTGTIRKTSRGNFDLVFYAADSYSYSPSGSQRVIRWMQPYDANVSIVMIGGGGGGADWGLSQSGAGGGLLYVNDLQLRANDYVTVTMGRGGAPGARTTTGPRGVTGEHSRVMLHRISQGLIEFRSGRGEGGASVAENHPSPPSVDGRYQTSIQGSNVGYDYAYAVQTVNYTPTSMGDSAPAAPYSPGVFSYEYTSRGPGGFGGRHPTERANFDNFPRSSSSTFNFKTFQFSRTCGGGAGGYMDQYLGNGVYVPYIYLTFGGISNADVPTNADTYRATWDPYLSYIYGLQGRDGDSAHTLSNTGGGAGGVWKLDSVFDQITADGFGTGIYGWNGYDTRTAYISNPGTYPNWNKPSVETLYGGYGAVLAGNMHPTFKTTTPTFGAGGRAGTGGYDATYSGGPNAQRGGAGVVRIMFDGDKRKFPNTNCGLEIQTTTMLWDGSTATWYYGEVVDPDNPYLNILTSGFENLNFG